MDKKDDCHLFVIPAAKGRDKRRNYKNHVYKSLRNDACLCAVRKPHNADLFDQCKSLKWEFGGDDDVVNDDCDDDDD